MNSNTIFRLVVSWFFFILTIQISPLGIGQQPLPPLEPVNVATFAIPFEIDSITSDSHEVELFVSKDRGRRWSFVDRKVAATGQFVFRAEGNGEYWFAFRTATSTNVPLYPEVRVLVDIGKPTAVPSPRSSESGPVVPPKPERFRPAHAAGPQPAQPQLPQLPSSMQQTNADSSNTSNQPAIPTTISALENAPVKRPNQLLAPRFPGFDPAEHVRNRGEDMFEDLLNGMSTFMDIQPVVAARSVPNKQIAENASATNNAANVQAGSISNVALDTKPVPPQIVVEWHTGQEQWQDAKIDIFRSHTDGQWLPIAINLPNNGEYWWYLSPEDMKPFYIAVKIRSPYGNREDVTQTKIEIPPQQAVFQSPLVLRD